MFMCVQCESDFVVHRPCEGDLSRQPYAKRECALLYSDVFAPCHNVVSSSPLGFNNTFGLQIKRPRLTHSHTQAGRRHHIDTHIVCDEPSDRKFEMVLPFNIWPLGGCKGLKSETIPPLTHSGGSQ